MAITLMKKTVNKRVNRDLWKSIIIRIMFIFLVMYMRRFKYKVMRVILINIS